MLGVQVVAPMGHRRQRLHVRHGDLTGGERLAGAAVVASQARGLQQRVRGAPGHGRLPGEPRHRARARCRRRTPPPRPTRRPPARPRRRRVPRAAGARAAGPSARPGSNRSGPRPRGAARPARIRSSGSECSDTNIRSIQPRSRPRSARPNFRRTLAPCSTSGSTARRSSTAPARPPARGDVGVSRRARRGARPRSRSPRPGPSTPTAWSSRPGSSTCTRTTTPR